MTDPRLRPVGVTERDWKLQQEAQEQRRRAEAYSGLVDAIREMIAARDLVNVSVQHFHGNRAEVLRDAKATGAARDILKSLGEKI